MSFKFFGKRKIKREKEYEDEKRKFEMAMGKPFIQLRIVMPEGFEDLQATFLSLENDAQFIEEIKDLIKKRLSYERKGVKPPF